MYDRPAKRSILRTRGSRRRSWPTSPSAKPASDEGPQSPTLRRALPARSASRCPGFSAAHLTAASRPHGRPALRLPEQPTALRGANASRRERLARCASDTLVHIRGIPLTDRQAPRLLVPGAPEQDTDLMSRPQNEALCPFRTSPPSPDDALARGLVGRRAAADLCRRLVDHT